jgi:hypothetical protein
VPEELAALTSDAARLNKLHISWQSGATVPQILPILGQWKRVQHLVLESSMYDSGPAPTIQELQTLITSLPELRSLRIAGFTTTRLQFELLTLAFTDYLNVHRPTCKYIFLPNIL